MRHSDNTRKTAINYMDKLGFGKFKMALNSVIYVDRPAKIVELKWNKELE